MYKSINRLFLLPKPNGQEVAFVISLEDPIRQGNQRFSHLVMNVKVCYQLVLHISVYISVNVQCEVFRYTDFQHVMNVKHKEHQVDIAMAADELREAYGNDKKGSAMLTPRLSGNLPDLVARIFKTVRADDS